MNILLFLVILSNFIETYCRGTELINTSGKIEMESRTTIHSVHTQAVGGEMKTFERMFLSKMKALQKTNIRLNINKMGKGKRNKRKKITKRNKNNLSKK